eukprot:CAMPEP_0202719200 /NCGR_PEP_ID=MMETSP1385-20130828/128972_1 /ASSEMBLY_ACC=CAM_ASM_000861 /TAXON_ID=933848 /ORGANISM="Elphidium margaritaceum" /LENGTH=67 /DNA_ID=CAMNT_0049382275 /DNA_START=1 /DNA_END=200 /DNA_ORIENTATION=+
MKWSRTRPSLAMFGDTANEYLFIVGDTQTHHAAYAEMYSFERREWLQIASVPYTAHNACLCYDSVGA